jgi:hypothetical protein
MIFFYADRSILCAAVGLLPMLTGKASLKYLSVPLLNLSVTRTNTDFSLEPAPAIMFKRTLSPNWSQA